MFFTRKERKRCHPCVKLAIVGLTVFGTVAMIDKGKNFMCGKMKGITKIFKKQNGEDSQCRCQ